MSDVWTPEAQVHLRVDHVELHTDNLFQAFHMDHPTVGIEINQVVRRCDHFALAVDQIAWAFDRRNLLDEVERILAAIWKSARRRQREAEIVRDTDAKFRKAVPFPTAEFQVRVQGFFDVGDVQPNKPIPVWIAPTNPLR